MTAAAAAPPPPTNPAAEHAFPSGDPRGAEYGETIAAAKHAFETTLAGDQEVLSDATSNAAYQRSLMGLAEPAGYRSEGQRASAGGILESGVNAQQRGSLASKYAEGRVKITKGLTETTDRVKRLNENAESRRESEYAKAATTALGKGYEALTKEGPDETAPPAPPAPTNPGGVKTVTGPAGPGGVQPYTEKLPGGGFVKVGQPQKPQTVQVRKAAAKKVTVG
jgi:hypothetical protein